MLDDAEERFKALAKNYVWFNPHLTLSGAWNGVDFVNVEATNPDWMKWRPAIRPARIGIPRRDSSAICQRTSRETGASGRTGRCASSSPNFVA